MALAECAFHDARKLGCESISTATLRADALLFGEAQSRVLVTLPPKDASAACWSWPRPGASRSGSSAAWAAADPPIRRNGREILRVPVGTAYRAWKDSLPAHSKVRTGGHGRGRLPQSAKRDGSPSSCPARGSNFMALRDGVGPAASTLRSASS